MFRKRSSCYGLFKYLVVLLILAYCSRAYEYGYNSVDNLKSSGALDSRSELLRDFLLPKWFRQQKDSVQSTEQMVEERMATSNHLRANEEHDVIRDRVNRMLGSASPFNLFKRVYEQIDALFDTQRQSLAAIEQFQFNRVDSTQLNTAAVVVDDPQSDLALRAALQVARRHNKRTESSESSESSEASLATCSGVGVEQSDGDCVCPVDFVGDQCQSKRSFLCRYELVSPTPHCETANDDDDVANYDELMANGDPICFRYEKAHDEPVFEYRMRCQFVDTDGLPSSVANDTRDEHQFDYLAYAWDDQGENLFAVSNAQNATFDWRLLLKVYNFEKMSDMDASQVVDLSPEQIVGDDTVSFRLPLASYSSRYLSGGRLYFECGLYAVLGVWPQGLLRRTHDRRFVDFADYEGKGTPSMDSTLPGWLIVLIIVCVIGIIAYSAYIVYRIREFLTKK